MPNDAHPEYLRQLCHAFQRLKDDGEIEQFLTDLMTTSELSEMSARWKAARMLDEGKSYQEIIDATGLSSATVARVSSWLKRGAGGYRLLLKRFSK